MAVFRVRAARDADSPNVRELVLAVSSEFGLRYDPDGYDADLERVATTYARAGGWFELLLDRNDIVGTVGMYPQGGGEIELRKMYFLGELRGTGMGTKLLNASLKAARKLGYRQCYLETLESMTHARHLYRKHGFTPLDEPLGDTGHYHCNTWMVKNLEEVAR